MIKSFVNFHQRLVISADFHYNRHAWLESSLVGIDTRVRISPAPPD